MRLSRGSWSPPAPASWAGSAGCVERLDLRLLVHQQHHGALRRIQVEPHDVDQLVFEVGALDCLNVSTRWVVRPRADQICCTLDLLIPACLAIDRTDQWVASGGVVWRVSCTTWSIFAWAIVGLRPRPGRTRPTLATPSSTKCFRHVSTVDRDTPSPSAMAVLDTPSAANSTPLASRTVRCDSDELAAISSSATRSSGRRSNRSAGG